MKLKPADYVSIFSLFMGWIAILSIINNKPFEGIILSSISIFIDTLDGYVARKMKQESILGTQLDSAIDIFNYLVFSSLFSYLFIFDSSILGLITGFTILAFGILRLVRLNQTGIYTDGGKRYYEGIVVTHIHLLVIFIFLLKQIIGIQNEYLYFIVLNFLSIMMISKIRTYKPKIPLLLYSLLGVFVFISLHYLYAVH